jgi:Arylsulfotransferase (ASST)
VAAALSLAGASIAQAATAPMISPQPGTPDASTTTQISIFGVSPGTIESVHVTGSASGTHAGRLERYSHGQGASYVVSKAFTPGETVTAVIRVKGLKTIRDRFGIEHPGTTLPILDIPKEQPAKLEHFVTDPALLPPKIAVHRGASKVHGDIFLTPLPSPEVHPNSNNELTINPVGPGGAEIIDPDGNLVWFHQVTAPDVAADLRIQTYGGHKVLTWWQGGVTLQAFGIGEGVIATTSYRTIATVHAGNGYSMDIHEFTLTPNGDALFTVYSPIMVHLPGTPAGKLSPLLDSIVQEVDIRTGLVVWEWHAYTNVPLKDSYATPASSLTYDAYHLNSIELLPGDHLLVSARDTCAVYDVDQRTGKIVWTLGGKDSTFKLGSGARFYFQHDAQMLPGDRVSLFDDEAGPPFYASTSRGLVLALDLKRHTARVAHGYSLHTKLALAESEGSEQTLSDGDAFVGFGSTPFFAEFSAVGALQYEATLPVDDGSYREYVFPWSATPHTKPVAAAKRVRGNEVDVYASWNGATTVARWQVLAQSSTSKGWKLLRTVARHGFETETTESSFLGCAEIEVRALSTAGKVLGTSKPVGLLCIY